MNKNKQSSRNPDLQDQPVQPEHLPMWKRVHHNWFFWIFLILMLGCILFYIMSIDFATSPHKPLKQPTENSRTP